MRRCIGRANAPERERREARQISPRAAAAQRAETGAGNPNRVRAITQGWAGFTFPTAP